MRVPPRSERGSAALEAAALVPLVVFVTTLLLQGATAVWTVTAADTAVRQAARAQSLGEDAEAAASAALPDGLVLEDIDTGPAERVRITVEVPRVSPLPRMSVSREATLP